MYAFNKTKIDSVTIKPLIKVSALFQNCGSFGPSALVYVAGKDQKMHLYFLGEKMRLKDSFEI